MRILALETSTRVGSVALLDQSKVAAEVILPSRIRTAQSLTPAIGNLLSAAGWAAQSIDLVALTSGPGSFTGLRIGVTTAKTFAYAVQADLIALNTLDVLAEQLPTGTAMACPLMDAQRRQFFAAVFSRSTTCWTLVQTCQIVDRDQLAPMLTPETILTGPALDRLDPMFLPDQPRSDPENWAPRAAVVGQLALAAHGQGQRDDPMKLAPNYFRPSYAEEE